MRQALILLSSFFVILFGACHQAYENKELSLHFQNPNNTSSPVIRAELADTGEKRQSGLMYRKELAETAGMLFIFPDEAPRSFWMKNTYLSLDMIFINGANNVVAIVRKAPPFSEEPQQSGGESAKFVLEVPAGASKKWGIEIGSRMQIDGNQALSSS